MSENIKHYYVFYTDDKGHNYYERTCGSLKAVHERMDILTNRYNYPKAFCYLNHIPKDLKYFY